MLAEIRMLAIALLGVLMASEAVAQEPVKLSRKEYIEQFAPLAVEQQALYGIPASITLAQGVLESGNGNSRLATEANNHFGIKCGGTWEGPIIRHDDDAAQECFRSYSSAYESYVDHSLFLSERERYSDLFLLDPMDYKGWAHGLKAAGYATNPKYAELLIKIIEDYELYRYDTALLADYVTPVVSAEPTPTEELQEAEQTTEEQVQPKPLRKVDVDAVAMPLYYAGSYGVYANERGRYVLSAEGDNVGLIAEQVGVSRRNLRRYNALADDYSLVAGQILYIERPL